MKKLFTMLMLCAIGSAAAAEAVNPDVMAFYLERDDAHQLKEQIAHIRSTRDQESRIRASFNSAMASDTPERQISGRIGLACRHLGHRNDLGCGLERFYRDDEHALTLLREAQQKINNMGQRNWNRWCASSRNNLLAVSGRCRWDAKKVGQEVRLLERTPDERARLEAARQCLASRCESGEFAATHPDLPRRLFLAGTHSESADGIRRSLPMTLEWYELAADQGHAGAAYMLAAHLMSGMASSDTDEKAAHYANLAAQLIEDAFEDEEQLALIFGSSADYRHLRISNYGREQINIERALTLRYAYLDDAHFLTRVEGFEPLARSGKLSAHDLYLIGLGLSRGEDRQESRPLMMPLTWYDRASDAGHEQATLYAYRRYSQLKTNDHTQWRHNYNRTEALADQLVSARHSSSRQIVIDRESENGTLARGSRDQAEKNRFELRRMHWLEHSVDIGIPYLMLRYAERLHKGPPHEYDGLYPADPQKAAAVIDKLPENWQKNHRAEDIVLAVRYPERIPEAMAQRKERQQQLSIAIAENEERERQNAIQEQQRQARQVFIDHIHQYGPSQYDVGAFAYDVEVYCRYGGPRCMDYRRQVVAFQRNWNRRAEASNLQRINQLHSGSGPATGSQEWWDATRNRRECMRRMIDSVERQTHGRQDWRYTGQCK